MPAVAMPIAKAVQPLHGTLRLSGIPCASRTLYCHASVYVMPA